MENINVMDAQIPQEIWVKNSVSQNIDATAEVLNNILCDD